ncbi:MAG TPA: hypothetical protein VJX67_08960 [Blastocatellia bacterium]|nr:hypothetical protein [Blastocatellia bacterium]
MANKETSEYILTVVLHPYCSECIKLKSKLVDVYNASGISRGEESKHWRLQIISPPWERREREIDFPPGFATVEVPAVKLEVDGRLAFAVQDAALIDELMSRLKWMLINHAENGEIAIQMEQVIDGWGVAAREAVACEATMPNTLR